MAFDMSDYVEVKDRLVKFHKDYPEGSIQTRIVEFTDTRVTVEASIYRTPEDIRPCVDSSYLNIPGSTSFTKGSELENASTSAVGRALAFMGYEVKKSIASKEEVAMKQEPKKPRGRPSNKDKTALEKEALNQGAVPICPEHGDTLKYSEKSGTGKWGHVLANGKPCVMGEDVGVELHLADVEIQGAN